MTPGTPETERFPIAVLVAAVTAVVAFVLVAVQLADGIAPVWDTVSYWSGAEAVTNGHPLRSHLQPSFSNFTVIEFLHRNGRLPFVDFPIGYPLLVGLIGIAVGNKAALVVMVVAGSVAMVVLIVLGNGGRRAGWAALAVRSVVAIGVLLWSPYRIVTRAGMTEPLFLALALGMLATLLIYRRDGRRWWVAVVLCAAAGLVRFVGAPFALLLVAERRRRDGGILRPVLWGALCLAPAALNALWTSTAGGGHGTRLHGIDGLDVERFARSVGGWFDARQANVGVTFFTDEGASWWAWPVTVVWIAAGLWALAGVAGLLRSRRWPEPFELCLAAASILTIGMVVGMASFDALLNPDNRVMLPAGVLTAVGIAWSVPRLARTPALVTVGVAAAWFLGSVMTRGGPDPFVVHTSEPATVAAARESGASVIVTTDADLVHWYTGIPAAYPPSDHLELSGEDVDADALWAALPCALADADGVVVVNSAGALFGYDVEALARLVDDGDLLAVPEGDATTYWPTPAQCPPP